MQVPKAEHYFLNVDREDPWRIPFYFSSSSTSGFITSFETRYPESGATDLFQIYSNPGKPGPRPDGEHSATLVIENAGGNQLCSLDGRITTQGNVLQRVDAPTLRVLPRCSETNSPGTGALDLTFDLDQGDPGSVVGQITGTPIDDPVVYPAHVVFQDGEHSFVDFVTVKGRLRAEISGRGARREVLSAQYLDFSHPGELSQVCAGPGSHIEARPVQGSWMVHRVHLEGVSAPVLCSQQKPGTDKLTLFTQRPAGWEAKLPAELAPPAP